MMSHLHFVGGLNVKHNKSTKIVTILRRHSQYHADYEVGKNTIV